MLEPPGTMRTPSSGDIGRTGYVDLSKKGSRFWFATLYKEKSTGRPMRKPSRMPFFTQGLARQPDFALGSGSAARISPRFNPCLNSSKSLESASVYSDGGSSNSRSIGERSMRLLDQTQGFEHRMDASLVFRFRRSQRETPDRLQQPHLRHGGLHGNRIRFDEVDLHQREVPAMELTSCFYVTAQGQVRQAGSRRWNFVRNNGDYPASAESGYGQSDGIIPRKHHKVLRHAIKNRGDLSDVSRRLFDPNNVLDGGKLLHRRRLDVHACAPLHAVENNWQRDRGGNGLVMVAQTVLGRLVVIRRYGEDAADSNSPKLAGQHDDLGGVVPAGPGQNWHLALRGSHHNLHHPQVFLARQRRTLSRRAARNKEVHSGFDLALHEKPQRRLVQRTIQVKWRNQGGTASDKHCLLLPKSAASRSARRQRFFSQLAKNLLKLEHSLFPADPPRRLQRAAGKSFTIARRMPQRNRVRRGIEPNFVRPGDRAGAVRSKVDFPRISVRSDLFSQSFQRSRRRIFLGGVMDFPAPGFVVRILREKLGGARYCLEEDVNADRKIGAPYQRGSRRKHRLAHCRQGVVPACSARNDIDA